LIVSVISTQLHVFRTKHGLHISCMDIRFDILIDYDSVKIGVYANQMNKMFTLDYLMYIEFIQQNMCFDVIPPNIVVR
jgi:hypothetical protein